MAVIIRLAEEKDAAPVAAIYEKTAVGNRDNAERAKEWVAGWFASPHFRCYVVTDEDHVEGFMIWQLQGGSLRATPMVEIVAFGITPVIEKSENVAELMEKTSRMVVDWLVETNNRIEDNVVFYGYAPTMDRNGIQPYLKFFKEMGPGMRKFPGGRNETFFVRRIPKYPFGP